MQQRRVRFHRLERVDDHGQRVVGDIDEIDAVLGDVAVVGDDDGDRFADVAHAADRQRPLVDGLLQHDQEGIGHRGDVLAGQHRVNARQGQGAGGIDRVDLGVRVRRAHDGGVKRSVRRGDVVRIATGAHEKGSILAPLQRLSDPAGPGSLAGRC